MPHAPACMKDWHVCVSTWLFGLTWVTIYDALDLPLAVLLIERRAASAEMWTGSGTPSWTTWHRQLAAMAQPCRSWSAACGPSRSTCQRAGQARTCRALTSARKTCAWRPACTTSSQPCLTSRFAQMLPGGPVQAHLPQHAGQYQQTGIVTALRDSNVLRAAASSPS